MEHLVGHSAGGAGAAGDIAGPGPQQSTVRTLSPAGAKLRHCPALGGPNDTVRLGGDEGLVIQGQQQVGFDELGLDGGGPDGEDGLPGEDGGTLGHGPDVASETELQQELEKFLAEQTLGAQKVYILGVKVQVLDISDDLLQPCGNGEAAPVGHVAEEHVEVADPVGQPSLEIAVAHSQLIEIEEHGVVDVVLHSGTHPFKMGQPMS